MSSLPAHIATTTHGAADGVLDAVGGTPLVRLRRFLPSDHIAVYAKLEAANPGGSAKDRPAAAMISDALARGALTPGMRVVESTSGNLGVGLAQACRFHGVPLTCVVDTRANTASIRRMRALGAEVVVVTEPDPETGDLLAARLRMVERMVAADPGVFWPRQYANPSNPRAHFDGTMREIHEALDGRLDAVVVPVGTTGTLVGCGDYLEAIGSPARIIAVDAVGSVLFGGSPGPRLLPGLGAGVVPPLAGRARCDEVLRVSDLDCVVGCRRLAEREAILVGASAGGAAMALLRHAARLPAGSTCAVVFPDGAAGYLESVFDDRWVERELGCPADELARRVQET